MSQGPVTADSLGVTDVKEIAKALTGWTGTSAEKHILHILERASGDPERLNYIFHNCDIAKLIDDLNDGLVFDARTALLQLLSGPFLSLLDSKSKELICLELRRRNEGGLEQHTMDILLVSNSRAAFESAELGLAWLKAHHRFATSLTLSKDILATEKTGSLAHTEVKEGVGTKALTALGEYVLSLLPHHGVGTRLENVGGYFDEFVSLLGFDVSFRSHLDFSGHAKLYADAAAFVGEVVRGLQMNPVIVSFVDEWQLQSASFKARSWPPPSEIRDQAIVKAVVYCFFIDLLTHSMMYEKPAYVEPVLTEGETLMEQITRVSTQTLAASEWWQYLTFSEQLELAGWELQWEKEIMPFKRSPFPQARSDDQNQKANLTKALIFEGMFQNLLQGCDEAAQAALALVAGTVNKGIGATAIPELGVSLWQESVLTPEGRRKGHRETCRMGFGSETEALPLVWGNLFVSWELASCTNESDAIMHFACALAPMAGSVYQNTEAVGLFLPFRTATQWLHSRLTALDRDRGKHRHGVVDWRAPQTAILWSKVNSEAGKQYLTRLEGIVNKLTTKTAGILKAAMAADHALCAKVQGVVTKYHDFEGMQGGTVLARMVSTTTARVKFRDPSEQTSRLFWQTMGGAFQSSSLVSSHEQTIFRMASRRFRGATSKVHVYEPEEKELVRRLGNGMIDPAYYNQRLKDCGTPLLEDLLFDKNSARTKALANQKRIGSLLVHVQSAQLVIPRPAKMYCLLETALTPRDGVFQGAIKTSIAEGVWGQTFLIPLSRRLLDNGASLTIELWSSHATSDCLVGAHSFSLADLQKYESKAFPLETTIPPSAHNLTGDVGALQIGICYVPFPWDPLSNYDEHTGLPDPITRATWPGNRSFALLGDEELKNIRSTMTTLTPTMKTGDLILWGSSLHKGDFPTRWMNSTITEATKSIYTHSALVFVAEHPETKDTFVYHIEAGVNRLLNTDCIAKTPFRNSIFVTDLPERLENYGATMVYLPLLQPLTPDQHDKMSRFLAHLWLRDPPFDSSQLVTAGLQRTLSLRLPDNTEDWSRLFCSEMCSASYKLAGLPEFQNLNTSTLPPADVASQSVFSKQRFVLKALDEHMLDKSIAGDREATKFTVEHSPHAPKPHTPHVPLMERAGGKS